MLDLELTMREDSIEELFAKKFEVLTTAPMDNKTAEIFYKLIRSKDSEYVVPEDEKPLVYKILEQRISKLHSFTVDDRVLLYLSWECKSSGIGVMYCWYLQYKSKTLNIKHFTFEIFSEVFRWGFPCQDELDKIWLKQKVNRVDFYDSDNLLDYPQAGKSLFE
jgi:hypothetical protein